MNNFMKNEKWTNPEYLLNQFDLSSIQKYVQNAISSMSSIEEAKLSSEVFETHTDVIARIKLPSKLHPRNVRVHVNTMNLKLEGLLEGKEKIFNLPCTVNAGISTALFKQGVLEIKMPKLKPRDRYHEVPVRIP